METSAHRSSWPLQIFLLSALVVLTGCGSAPPRDEPRYAPRPDATDENRRHVGLAIAAGQVGTPYRYGGEDPGGFDCSGLVFYAFRKAGIDAPRTTREQFKTSRPVSPARMEPGDLLFFKLNLRKVSHVGIYAGGGRFVHAPSNGKQVSYARLEDPYWQTRLKGVRRLD
jgi:cell wall-associated NlpC family hydrolase